MKVLCLLALGVATLRGQAANETRWIAVSGGMGMNLFSSPSITDYINLVGQPIPGEEADEFSSSIEFFVSPELQVAEFWSAGLEYTHIIKSYSVNGSAGESKFTYVLQVPSVRVHYLVPAEGYGFKLGGSVGYARGTMSEALYGDVREIEYRATGLSAKLDAIGVTKFDSHFYGVIAFDIRWVLGGVFRNDVRELKVGETSASLNSFSAGVKFGVEFQW